MNELGICLIGAGRAGMIHANNFQSRVKGARMTAVVDAVEAVAKDAAKNLGDIAWYTDYRQALLDPNVDAVVVVSPTNLHREIVMESAKAKKHVFCEKPMGMNVQECQDMIQACDENNVKFQIGFMRRFDTSFARAKEVLESGAIGDLCLVHSHTRGPSKPREWMYDIKKSNGLLAEVNSHDIDCIRWLTGSEFETVYATASNSRNKERAEEYPDYYDNVIMTGKMANGVQYMIDGAAYVQYGYDASVELIGTKGKIQVGRNEANFLETTTVETGTAKPFIRSWTDLFKEAYQLEDQGFVDAILGDLDPKVTGRDGLMAVKIVELGNQSIFDETILRVEGE